MTPMSEGSEPGEEEILGRLPRTRPGRRSPRRDEASAKRARARQATTREPDAEAEPQAAATPPAEDRAGATDAVVGLARTGVGVAAGTVGLGLRAAGGLARAIRDTVDRS